MLISLNSNLMTFKKIVLERIWVFLAKFFNGQLRKEEYLLESKNIWLFALKRFILFALFF